MYRSVREGRSALSTYNMRQMEKDMHAGQRDSENDMGDSAPRVGRADWRRPRPKIGDD